MSEWASAKGEQRHLFNLESNKKDNLYLCLEAPCRSEQWMSTLQQMTSRLGDFALNSYPYNIYISMSKVYYLLQVLEKEKTGEK
jgi:hypothetical protein